MKKATLFSSIVVGFMMCACNGNEDFTPESSNLLKSINVSIEDASYDLELSTRSSYVVDPVRGFISSWEAGDTLGIYPIGGDQVAFPISEGEGTKNAKFDGGAWALRSSFQYAAYYPFNKKNYYVSEKEIPVTYTGQKQTENNSTAHLAAYDYLAAAATSPNSEGNVNLTMKRLGCFVRIQIPVKVSGTFTELNLSTSEALLTAEGTINLQAATPSITTKTAASVLTVSLNNIVIENGETLVVYAMLAPADLSNQTLTFTLKSSANSYYCYTTAGYNMVAGKAYNYAIADVPDANGHDYVDLGLPSGTLWATMNIGANAPQEIGHYYFWGDYVPVEETLWDKDNLKQNYKFYTFDSYGTRTSITKYSVEDEKAFLDEEDDVAHVEWGGSWRIPTITELEELMNQCTMEAVIAGFTKTVIKVTGPNGNYIILPMGYMVTDRAQYDSATRKYKYIPRLGESTYDDNTGYYWSRQIDPRYTDENYSSSSSWPTYLYTASKCLRIHYEGNQVTSYMDQWQRGNYCLNVRAVL